MKRVCLSICIVVASCNMAACADKAIDAAELPQAAKAFLNRHFADTKVSFASVDRELFDKTYEVILADGGSVEFDGDGQWRDIDCKRGRVPQAVIPEAIRDHIAAGHPANFVREINRDRRDWEISLDNGLELKFDRRFRLVEYDD